MASFDYDVVIVGSGFGASAVRGGAVRGRQPLRVCALDRWAVRTVGPGDAIPNDFVVPYYLDEVQEVDGGIQIRA